MIGQFCIAKCENALFFIVNGNKNLLTPPHNACISLYLLNIHTFVKVFNHLIISVGPRIVIFVRSLVI